MFAWAYGEPLHYHTIFSVLPAGGEWTIYWDVPDEMFDFGHHTQISVGGSSNAPFSLLTAGFSQITVDAYYGEGIYLDWESLQFGKNNDTQTLADGWWSDLCQKPLFRIYGFRVEYSSNVQRFTRYNIAGA